MNEIDLAVCLLSHGDTPVVKDTIDSIKTWATDKILLMVDGNQTRWFEKVSPGVPKKLGFPNLSRPNIRPSIGCGSYRNSLWGLKACYELYPDAHWYCMCEYDVLFGSSQVLRDLVRLPPNVWCAGNDMRVMDHMKLPFLDSILNTEVKEKRYLLGCCVFYLGGFVKSLIDSGVIDRLLYMTNDNNDGFFPDFWEQNGYDFNEMLLPTLAKHYGGEVCHFCLYHEQDKKWLGNERYLMRWPDEIRDDEPFQQATLIHPTKDYDDNVRQYHRKKRKALRR